MNKVRIKTPFYLEGNLPGLLIFKINPIIKPNLFENFRSQFIFSSNRLELKHFFTDEWFQALTIDYRPNLFFSVLHEFKKHEGKIPGLIIFLNRADNPRNPVGVWEFKFTNRIPSQPMIAELLEQGIEFYFVEYL